MASPLPRADSNRFERKRDSRTGQAKKAAGRGGGEGEEEEEELSLSSFCLWTQSGDGTRDSRAATSSASEGADDSS